MHILSETLSRCLFYQACFPTILHSLPLATCFCHHYFHSHPPCFIIIFYLLHLVFACLSRFDGHFDFCSLPLFCCHFIPTPSLIWWLHHLVLFRTCICFLVYLLLGLARDKTATTTWPCFQAKKMCSFLLCLLHVFVVSTHLDTETSIFFWFFLVLEALLHCHALSRSYKELSRAQLCSYTNHVAVFLCA